MEPLTLLFAHTLNLIVHGAIAADEGVTILQKKCKNIVSYFHRSVKAADKLSSIQTQPGRTLRHGGTPLFLCSRE